MRDLERQATPAFPFYFDTEAAEHAISFFAFLRHSKGEWAGRPLTLEPWEQFIAANLFGWRRQADGLRRFRVGYVAVPRKNGKSTLLAGIGVYLTIADGEPGAEVYSAATTRDQARIVFDEAVKMRNASPALASRLRAFRNALYAPASTSRFMALASEDNKLDGLNPHGVIVDELHAHPSRALWDVLDTGTGARRQPLMLAITTAGSDPRSFCRVQHDYGLKILDRIFDDETFFVFVTEIDEGADWQAEAEWYKANPNLGISVKIDDLRRKAARAAKDPTALNAFLRLHLNVWTRAETRAILPEVWKSCAGVTGPHDPIEVRALWLEQMTGLECFGGLDLATTVDIAAWVLHFPKSAQNPFARLLPFFFVPEATIAERSKRDRVPYDVWARQGFVIPTPGNVIDYSFIRQTINAHKSKYAILDVGFDPYNATQLVGQLAEDGVKTTEVRQGYLSLTAPTKEFLRRVLSGTLAHGDNPVLAWMADNLVTSQDPAGNLKPDKEKAREKIDGIVATILAIGRDLAGAALLGSSTKKLEVYVL